MILSQEVVEITTRKTAKVLLAELQILADKMFAACDAAPPHKKTMTLEIPKDQYQAIMNYRPKFRPTWNR